MAEIPSAEASAASLINTINGIARSNDSAEIMLGKVIAPLPDIKIAVNGIILDINDIYIDVALLRNYTRTGKGTIKIPEAKGNVEMGSVKGEIRTTSMVKAGGVGRPSFVSHSHKINNSYKADAKSDYKADLTGDYSEDFVTTDFGLEVGDTVALLAINSGQKFIVISKVIAGGEINDYSRPIDSR